MEEITFLVSMIREKERRGVQAPSALFPDHWQ